MSTIRAMSIEGEPWFVASDVAKALGYKHPSSAVATHCRASSSVAIRHTTARGGNPNATIIPERDVYRLVFCSTLLDRYGAYWIRVGMRRN